MPTGKSAHLEKLGLASTSDGAAEVIPLGEDVKAFKVSDRSNLEELAQDVSMSDLKPVSDRSLPFPVPSKPFLISRAVITSARLWFVSVRNNDCSQVRNTALQTATAVERLVPLYRAN